MEDLIAFIFYFAIFVGLVGLVMQFVPLRISGIVYRNTSEEVAWWRATQYAQATFENRFGYPTGFFYYDEEKSQRPALSVLSEAQPSGSVTDGCSASFANIGFGAGCGCVPALIIFAMALPFFAFSALDRLFRKALQSRIKIHVQRAGADSVVDMEFYGLSGYIIRETYKKVFSEPQLPEDLKYLVADTSVKQGESA